MTATVRVIAFTALCISECLFTQAQRMSVGKNEFGISVGVLIYQGDLTPYRLGAYNTARPAINAFFSRTLNSAFAARTNLTFGGLHGDDASYSNPAYRRERALNFRTPVFELSELVVVNPLRNNSIASPPGLSPYIMAGIGLSFIGVRRDDSHFNSEFFSSEPATIGGLDADQRHSLPWAIPVIPVGVGIKYAISPKLLLTLETSYRFTFTDYLDGYSKVANPNKKDSYQSHTIGVIFRFVTDHSLKCPVF